MMTVVPDVLFVVFLSAILGFCSSQITNWLDLAMDYGKVFWKIRYKLVESAAIKSGMGSEFKEQSERHVILEDFSERITLFDRLYWRVAHKRPIIQWILCIKCLGTRVYLTLFAITALLAFFTVGLPSIFLVLTSLIVSFSFNNYFL